jgi:hypothetical protein
MRTVISPQPAGLARIRLIGIPQSTRFRPAGGKPHPCPPPMTGANSARNNIHRQQILGSRPGMVAANVRSSVNAPKIKISPPIFPTPCPCPYNHAVPQRIHRQACRRCGAGALRQETTQILRQRVRELVSLRRHGGNGGALDRSCRFISGHERRACLCGTQGNRRLASAARGPAGSFPSGKLSGAGGGKRCPLRFLQRERIARKNRRTGR